MPVDIEDVKEPKRAAYRFLRSNRGKAYTKDEIMQECGLEELRSFKRYGEFRPFKIEEVYNGDSRLYTARVNRLFVITVLVSMAVVGWLVWLSVTNPSALA